MKLSYLLKHQQHSINNSIKKPCFSGNINDIWGDLQRTKGGISKGQNTPSGDWYHSDRVAKGKGEYPAVTNAKGPSGKGWS